MDVHAAVPDSATVGVECCPYELLSHSRNNIPLLSRSDSTTTSALLFIQVSILRTTLFKETIIKHVLTTQHA